MAIAREGASSSFTQCGSSQSGSANITVPSGTDCLVIYATAYSNADLFTGGSAYLRLNTSVNPNVTVSADQTSSYWLGGAWVFLDPPTGTVAVGWNWNEAPITTPALAWAAYSGVDSIRTSGSSRVSDVVTSPASTGAITTVVNDVIALSCFYQGGDSVTFSNATVIQDFSVYGGSDMTLGELTADGTSETISVNGSTGDPASGGMMWAVMVPAVSAVVAYKPFRRMNTLLRLCWAGIGILGGYANVLRAHVCERIFEHKRIDSRREGDLPYSVGCVCGNGAA